MGGCLEQVYEETTSRYPFLAPGIHSGKPYRYSSHKTGLPDIHPRKPAFQISIPENRPSRYPSQKTGLPDIHPIKPAFQISNLENRPDIQISILETGPSEFKNPAPVSQAPLLGLGYPA
jgi:hypothetical protein